MLFFHSFEWNFFEYHLNYFTFEIRQRQNPLSPQFDAGPTFSLQAKSTKDDDIIGREGPVGIGQPGVVRAPSGLIMGLPAIATPANKGMQPLKSSLRLNLCLQSSYPNFSFDLPYVADVQGVSWEGPTDVGRSTSGIPPEEPLYAVPKKEHQPKFTIEDFVLHKMLGKGSFGKVLGRFWKKIWEKIARFLWDLGKLHWISPINNCRKGEIGCYSVPRQTQMKEI